MKTNFCFEKDIEKIENYELAKKDNFKDWVIHHRLELETSDGEKRLPQAYLLSDELIALNMYFYRPPEELIFMKRSEHVKLHNSFVHKGKIVSDKCIETVKKSNTGKETWNKGRKILDTSKMNKASIGVHWYTNGEKCIRAKECPDGFKLGRVISKTK